MRSKKATGIQNYAIVIGLIMGLTLMMVQQTRYTLNGYIGESLLSLDEIKDQAGDAELFLDAASHYSATQAIIDAARRGGMVQPSCGIHQGYTLWMRGGEQCTPTPADLEDSISTTFLASLDEKLAAYNGATSGYIRQNNYDEVTVEHSLSFSSSSTEPIIIKKYSPQYVEAVRKEEQSLSAYELKSAENVEERGELKKVAGMQCTGSCLLREDAHQRILLANEIAKKRGFEIAVYSSYRSYEAQKLLWEGETNEQYAERYPNEQLRARYVCDPGDSEEEAAEKCPHLTGRAVDIRKKGKSSNPEMTSKDWDDVEKAMVEAGWVRYGHEEWHFEYNTERWARAQEAGVSVIV